MITSKWRRFDVTTTSLLHNVSAGNGRDLQARETYDDAITSGRAAFLMEESQTSGDIFECLVGNLPPHQDAVVTFAYVIELELEVDGGVCFQLPSVIKPRYQHDTGKGKAILLQVCAQPMRDGVTL